MWVTFRNATKGWRSLQAEPKFVRGSNRRWKYDATHPPAVSSADRRQKAYTRTGNFASTCSRSLATEHGLRNDRGWHEDSVQHIDRQRLCTVACRNDQQRTVWLNHWHHGFQRQFAITSNSHIRAHDFVDVLWKDVEVDDATSSCCRSPLSRRAKSGNLPVTRSSKRTPTPRMTSA